MELLIVAIALIVACFLFQYLLALLSVILQLLWAVIEGIFKNTIIGIYYVLLFIGVVLAFAWTTLIDLGVSVYGLFVKIIPPQNANTVLKERLKEERIEFNSSVTTVYDILLERSLHYIGSYSKETKWIWTISVGEKNCKEPVLAEVQKRLRSKGKIEKAIVTLTSDKQNVVLNLEAMRHKALGLEWKEDSSNLPVPVGINK